jgi:GTP-binding protein Era
MAVSETRCGYVAILGAPNAGKSTLLNRFVGSKVSIVSPKVQTTRVRTMAIAMANEAQMIFVDTPGIFEPKRRLEKAMVAAAWDGAVDADVVLLLIDAHRGVDPDVRLILRGLENVRMPVFVALNKIDAVPREKLLGLTSELIALRSFAGVYFISALDGDGTNDVKAALAEALPVGQWLYPEDQLTDISERLLAAEITREKLFLRLHQELPYHLTVETETWTDQKDGSAKVEQVIYVTRDNHKPIVLGKGGQTIKAIGALARHEMEQVLDRRIHLFLFVKVRENWTDDPERYRAMGLDFPKS